MSRFKKLSHTLWHCQYHIVWTPKYRFRILENAESEEVERCIRTFSEQKRCDVLELNIQRDHVHLVVLVPPKISISEYLGNLKGRTAIRVFNEFRKLRGRLPRLLRRQEANLPLTEGNTIPPPLGVDLL